MSNQLQVVNEPKVPLFSQEESQEEPEQYTKYTYYIRKKNQWVPEKSLDEMAFKDSNELFCNLKNLK
jgi:hypothetical protein